MQPVTINFAFLDIRFSICSILSIASLTAGSINPHVLIITASHFAGSVSAIKPSLESSPIKYSKST